MTYVISENFWKRNLVLFVYLISIFNQYFCGFFIEVTENYMKKRNRQQKKDQTPLKSNHISEIFFLQNNRFFLYDSNCFLFLSSVKLVTEITNLLKTLKNECSWFNFYVSNVRGIQGSLKGIKIFEYLKNQIFLNGFAFLQKTHSYT